MSIPTVEDLPLLENSFHDAKSLIENYNQSKYFQTQWGNNYFEQASSLWEEHIKLFNNKKDSNCTVRELLLVMGFDYYAGPHLGLPEKIKIKFYHWLISTIKERLENEET